MYDYSINEPSSFDSMFTTNSAVMAILFIILFVIVVALAVLVIASNCIIFKKAGEKWWKALIPLYNSWIETKITGLAWWWFPIFAVLTGFITSRGGNYVYPMALVLVSFNYSYNMAKKFGKSNGFALLMTILPVIGLPMLAFGNSTYNKEIPVDKNGIFFIENM